MKRQVRQILKLSNVLVESGQIQACTLTSMDGIPWLEDSRRLDKQPGQQVNALFQRDTSNKRRHQSKLNPQLQLKNRRQLQQKKRRKRKHLLKKRRARALSLHQQLQPAPGIPSSTSTSCVTSVSVRSLSVRSIQRVKSFSSRRSTWAREESELLALVSSHSAPWKSSSRVRLSSLQT